MKPFAAVLLLFINAKSISQNNHFSIDRPSIKQLQQIEKANHGDLHWSPSHVEYTPAPEEILNSERYHFAQPITSFRQTRPWSVYVEYFYSVPDSMIRMIDHHWNLGDSTSALFLFDSNAKQFDKLFGNQGKKVINNQGFGKFGKWENDKVRVTQYTAAGSMSRLGRKYPLDLKINWK